MTDFPPIHVIILPEEPWKRDIITSEFAEQGLAPRFVDGVFGPACGLRPTNAFDYDPHGKPTYLHSTQVGCVLSHRIALSVALSHEDDEFLIAETDISLVPDFTARFIQWRKSLPSDATVGQLDYCGESDRHIEVLNDFAARIQYPFGSGLIWWTRRAALQAIRSLTSIDRPYDIMLIQRVFPFESHVVALPKLAYQKSVTGEWAKVIPCNAGKPS